MKTNSAITLTISPEVKALLKSQSALFGGNQSAYITHLILKESWTLKDSNINVTNNEGTTVVDSPNSKVKTKTKKL